MLALCTVNFNLLCCVSITVDVDENAGAWSYEQKVCMIIRRKDNRMNRDYVMANSSTGLIDDSMPRHKKENRRGFIRIAMTCALLPLIFSTFVFSDRTTASAHGNSVYGRHPGTAGTAARAVSGLTPQDLWKMYNLPGLNGGAGQLIGEAIDGSIPSMDSDLHAYSLEFGLPDCTVANGCLTIKYQGGQKIPNGSDPAEGILDVETMHAIAPKAKILLYIMNTDNASIAVGPSQILTTPGLKAINMSYGFNGNGKAYESLYGDNPNHVALFAASGDDGNGVLDPPSIYPGVIAVGGTVVKNGVESAWFGSGGGLSKLYPEPAYQKTYGIPQANGYRGNPDVAAVAGTPVAYYELGKWTTEMGTSVASPIWTGIAALVNKPITDSLLYSLAKSKPDSFNDITTGTNGKCGFICTAQPGYDYVTGLGTPKNFVANVNAMP
jgi:subtilase family serine protease